jgi:prepilin-type N-terminal cleavage/methylation domain-containing protein
MRQRSRGFTLLELMLVVGIIATLAGISIGYSGTYRRTEQFKETTRAVISGIGQARAEAVRRSTKVMVHFGAQRITAFVDSNSNFVYDAGEPLVWRYPNDTSTTLPSGMTLTSTKLVASNPQAVPTAIFDFQGYSNDSVGNPISAIICVKDSTLKETRAVQLTVAGAARAQAFAAAKVLCP